MTQHYAVQEPVWDPDNKLWRALYSDGKEYYSMDKPRYKPLVTPTIPGLPPGYTARRMTGEDRVYVYDERGTAVYMSGVGVNLEDDDYRQIWDYFNSHRWHGPNPSLSPPRTWSPPVLSIGNDEFKIHKNVLAMLLAGVGGSISFDGYDLGRSSEVTIETVTFQDPHRWSITLQEKE